ncbi:MAG: hypothetical protein ACOC24_05715 [Desulfovibrionales bacterium]
MQETGVTKRDQFQEVFDPELLFIQCAKCGRSMNWSRGVTTKFLKNSGIDAEMLDPSFLILSMGCSECLPEETGYVTKLVKLTSEDEGETRHSA